MKKLLSLAAALTFTLTACTAPTSDTLPATPETTAPEESTTTQDVGSGEVRMLSAADGGIYYQTFADSEVNHEVDIGRNLVYAVEETTGLACPACNVPGCTHDSDACPAYIQGSATCYADVSEVYLYICLYKEAEDTTVFRLEKINADHTQRTCLADDLPFGWVQPVGMAADDTHLYFLTTDNYSNATMSAMLLAVSKATGDMQTLYQLDGLENGRGSTGQVTFVNLVGASGCQLYFTHSETNPDPNKYYNSAVQVWCYDLAANQCTAAQRYEVDDGTIVTPPQEVHDDYGNTYTNSGVISHSHLYYTLTGYYGSFSSGIAECDNEHGTAAVRDAATGQRTVLAENLPTTTAEYEVNYSVARYHDGWLLTVDEWGRGSDGIGTGDGTSAQYFCDGSGQMTLIPQKRYAEGKGVQNIQILDIQNGQVLVIYDEQIDTRQGIDKSGTAYTYTPVWRLYGVMPLEDLLAGSIDFTPLQFIS